MPPGLVRLPDGRLVARGSKAERAYWKKTHRPDGTSKSAPKPVPASGNPPKPSAPARAASPAPAPTSEHTPAPKRKVKTRRPAPLPMPDFPPGMPAPPMFGPTPVYHKPRKTDWRVDPGGGYVEIHSGAKVAIPRGDQEDKAHEILANPGLYNKRERHIAQRYVNAYEAARQAQRKQFAQAKEFEREAEMRVPPSMRAEWDAEAQAAFDANPRKYGLPTEDRPWWSTPGTRLLRRVIPEAGRTAAAMGEGLYHGLQQNISEFDTGLSAAGRGNPAGASPIVGKHFGEHVSEAVVGKALTNALLHGDFSHPKAIALEALMLPIPLKGAPMVGTAMVRLGAGIRAARELELGGKDSIALAARMTNMTNTERKALKLVPFEFGAWDAPETNFISDARTQWYNTLRVRVGKKVADAYIELADARAASVHRQITDQLDGLIAGLDEKVANGTATTQDVLLRKELGFQKRFGVPKDWYYSHLHDSGSGIPEWVQRVYQDKYPGVEMHFAFEGPARGGANFGEEAISKRLAAKLNPKNALRGLPENPTVKVRGLPVVGPITDAQWLKRVMAVMPDKQERTFWATWYQSFEPLFRKAFGEDADAIMRGFAASQANTSPAGGLGATLKVMDRLRRGEEVTNEGIGQVAMAIQDAVKGTPMEEGMAAKLSDFTDALGQLDTRTWMGHAAEGGAPAPADIWAGRDLGHVDPKMVGYLENRFGLREGVDFKVDSPGAPTGGRYERISEQYHSITDMLNKMEGGKGFDGHQWKPADVQALGWGTIQKFLGVDPEDIGYALDRNAWEVATEVTKGATGIGADLTVEQAQHVSTLFEDDIRRLIEDTPGVYLNTLTDEPFAFTTGGWAGGQNGSIQFKLIGTERDVQHFINRLAQSFDQEYVQATRRTSAASETAPPKSALVISSKAFENERAKQTFFEALAEKSPQSAPARGEPKEPELQGYARHDPVEGVESIVIRTHNGTKTGKTVEPWLRRYDDAIKYAEDKTGIRVTTDQENLQMIVGGQHGAVEAAKSVPGAAGGRGALDDQLAAGIRQKLESAVRGVTARSAEEADGLAASSDLERRIAEQTDLINQRVKEREGITKFQLHGVHAHNRLPVPNHGIPPGMSSLHLGLETPMPGRIAVHEEGHYIDTHILPKYPKAQKVVEDLLRGADKETRAETFARWAEEYVLVGGGPNLPEELKPAMREVSNHILEETANYAGRASERIWLPPEVAEVFDAIHGWEDLTGEVFKPGDTTYESALNDLNAKFDEGPITEDEAVQGARFLRYNDKVQQIHGQASKRMYFRRAIEHAADKISQALTDSGRFRAIANFTHVSSEMRVSKHAAREAMLEGERAAGRMHGAAQALPKEGNVTDVAHAIWAQLPEKYRNVNGLVAWRDKQAAELEEYTSGRILQQTQDALGEAEDTLKAMEWTDPERWDQVSRVNSLRTLLSDLPHIEDDLKKQVAVVDAAIAAKPELDPKVIDAVATLSRDRERTLLEAGATGADEQRFENRRSLVSNWLGLESDGSEVYLGHRMGRERGNVESPTPGGLGLGRPRSPQGLSRANELRLAETGRLRLSTHVAYEDWAKAEQYRTALVFRDDLGKMGTPYDGGRIPEDAVLVNPKGRVIPRAWKRDPWNLSDSTEQEVEQRLKEQAAGFFTPGGDSKAATEAREAMIAAAKEDGLNLSDLRVVTKDAFKNYRKWVVPVGQGTKGGRVYDQLVNVMSANLIFLRLGYIPKNVTQNLIMAIPHQGVYFLPNATRAGELMFNKRLVHLLNVETGGGAAAGLEREAAPGLKGTPKLIGKAAHTGAHIVTGIADNPIRATAFLHEAAKEGVIPRLSLHLRPEDEQALEHLLTDPSERVKLNRIMQRTRDHMGDFNRMSKTQRHWARRFLVIPGWLLAGSRYPVYFGISHPLRSAAIAYALAGAPGTLNAPGIQDIWHRYGPYNEGLAIPGSKRVLRTTSISPINTPLDIAAALGDKRKQTAFGYANPLIPALLSVLQGENRYGVKVGYGSAAADALQSLSPNYSLITGLAAPHDTGTYPGDATRWGRLQRELGIVPIELKVGGHAAKKKTDEWQQKIDDAVASGVELSDEDHKALEAAIATKGEWESIKAQLPDSGSSDEKAVRRAVALFDLLVKHQPQYASRREEVADMLKANPSQARSLEYRLYEALGWSALSRVAAAGRQAKKAKEKVNG